MDSSPFETDGLSENLLGPSFDLEQHGTSKANDYEPLTPSSAATHVSPGSKQPEGYRDIGPALLFIVHVAWLLYLAIMRGIPSLHYQLTTEKEVMPDRSIYYPDDDKTVTTITFTGMLAVTTLSSFVSLILTACVAWVLVHCLSQMVQFSLIFAIAANALLVVYFALQHLFSGVAVSMLLLFFGVMYARAVWKRMPFATANLTSASAALQANAGVALVAYAMVGLFGLYACVFLLAWLGVYLQTADCHADPDYCNSHMNKVWALFFTVSFYWTAHTIKNLLHVTVAGLVGTWYFAPLEATQFCSPAIMDSLSRACTWSFGSVCLGSFMTAILQLLYTAARHMTNHFGRGSSFMVCVLQCLLGFLDRLAVYFNKYAMVYVGLYGYDYMSAGKKTADLFVARGWTVILNEDLVGRVLMLMNLVIGSLTGACGLYLASKHPSWTMEFGTAQALVAFGFPFFIGTAMSSVLLGVVSSSVDTILVTFCEAPLDMERNHPGLHRQMMSAWRQVYPEVDMNVPS